MARRREALDKAAEGIISSGAKAAAVVADLARREEIGAAAARAAEPFGPVDILVNAAGINLREPAEAITPESWDRTLSINLTAPFFLAREVVPAMRGKGWDGSSTSRPCSRCAPFRVGSPTAPPRAAWRS